LHHVGRRNREFVTGGITTWCLPPWKIYFITSWTSFIKSLVIFWYSFTWFKKFGHDDCTFLLYLYILT
jgi:hypothetical protein